MSRYIETMKYFILLLFPLLLLSCANDASRSSEGADSAAIPEDDLRGTGMAEQERRLRREQYFIWDVDADKKTISKNPHLKAEFFNVDTLIEGLNEKYPEIVLEKRRISNDTLYAEIKNAEYLTNQMGSLGSEQYIAQAVINLTAIEGIRYVRIDFAEGSHAAPDTWSREQFAHYKEQEDVRLQ